MLAVILCAGGSGTRSKLPENKIFYELNGLPVLVHALSAFAPFADDIVVACRGEDEARIRPLLAPFPMARTVHGGATRAESVYSALKTVTADMVLVHDAVRPFVTPKIIEDCIAYVKRFGSGICALPATDTTVLAKDMQEMGVHMDRADLYTVQTPQGFYTEELRAAYDLAAARGKLGEYTDDSMLYNAYAKRNPRLFLGDPCNKKLTYPADFLPAERVGFGVDTHAFAHQDELGRGIARLDLNYIKLGGVLIPSDRAIEAHSDGDVVCHALMDALLTAIGERDIGYHFPDADPAYKDADSMQLLARVLDMVWGKQLAVQNASVSILAEHPRLSPYIGAMKQSLSAALQCENVGIAAGTNEKLGYIGEGRGITCYATVLLRPAARPET